MGECERCGIANPVWFTQSWLWTLVMGDEFRGAILCPACFIIVAEKAGVLPSAWLLTPESGIAPVHSDPPPAPLVADPKMLTDLIQAGTKVPPPLDDRTGE